MAAKALASQQSPQHLAANWSARAASPVDVFACFCENLSREVFVIDRPRNNKGTDQGRVHVDRISTRRAA
jgi:hypothetical protein